MDKEDRSSDYRLRESTSMKRVVWDEENLEYNDATKSSTQKITEPKTPYHAPLPDGEGSPGIFGSPLRTGAVNADAVRSALSDIAGAGSAGGGASSSEASSSRSRSEWASSEDERTEDEAEMMDHDRKEEGSRRSSFEEHRRKHYDEFRKAKLLQVDVDDEGEEVEGLGEEGFLPNGNSHFDGEDETATADSDRDNHK